MKIYVDGEMPKCCNECEWFTPNHCSKNGRNFCLVARMPFYNTEEDRKTSRGQHKGDLSDFDCPLHPVAERDAEVRKEVVGEMKELAKNEFEFLVCDECYNTIDGDVYISSVALSEILDQVERREDNERNS